MTNNINQPPVSMLDEARDDADQLERLLNLHADAIGDRFGPETLDRFRTMIKTIRRSTAHVQAMIDCGDQYSEVAFSFGWSAGHAAAYLAAVLRDVRNTGPETRS